MNNTAQSYPANQTLPSDWPLSVKNDPTPHVHPLTGQIDEAWKPLAGFEGFWEISTLGQVRRCKTGKLEPQFRKGNDRFIGVYHPITGKYTFVAIHRAVALAFIPNPNNWDWVKRKDANPLHNQVTNLVWVPSPQQKAASRELKPTPSDLQRPETIPAIEDCMAPTFSANATLVVEPTDKADYPSLVDKVVVVVVKAKLFAYYLGRVVSITDEEVRVSRDNPQWPDRTESRSVIAGIARVVSVVETSVN